MSFSNDEMAAGTKTIRHRGVKEKSQRDCFRVRENHRCQGVKQKAISYLHVLFIQAPKVKAQAVLLFCISVFVHILGLADLFIVVDNRFN